MHQTDLPSSANRNWKNVDRQYSMAILVRFLVLVMLLRVAASSGMQWMASCVIQVTLPQALHFASHQLKGHVPTDLKMSIPVNQRVDIWVTAIGLTWSRALLNDS